MNMYETRRLVQFFALNVSVFAETDVYMPKNALSCPNRQIPPFQLLTLQSSVMTMTHASTPVNAQMSLSHDLSITACRTRSDRLEHHMSEVAEAEFGCAVANE